MLKTGHTQRFVDPAVVGTLDLQEVASTYHQLSLRKVRLYHTLVTHHLPLLFPEEAGYLHSSRATWGTSLLHFAPSPAAVQGPRAQQLRAGHRGAGLGDRTPPTELPCDRGHPIGASRDVFVAGGRQLATRASMASRCAHSCSSLVRNATASGRPSPVCAVASCSRTFPVNGLRTPGVASTP